MPPAPRLPLLPLFTALLLPTAPASAAEPDCDQLESRVLGELNGFVADRAAILDLCHLNARAPANNRVPGFAQGGICERTYKFMNGFVLETRKKLGAACAALGPRAGCASQNDTGQATCLRAAGARFEKASKELAAARDLLASAEKKMQEQREQNKLVGLAFAENLTRIKHALGATSPRVLALSRHEPSGADSLRTEGLPSLREVLEKSQISENTRAIENRASQITLAFAPGSMQAADGLGPFAGEQLAAFRRAGSFAAAARRLRPELALVAESLEGNGRRALAGAERLERGEPAEPPKSSDKPAEQTAGPVSLPRVAPVNPGPAPSPGRHPSSRSDLQLAQKTAALLGAAAALNEPAPGSGPPALPKNSPAAPLEPREQAPAAEAASAPGSVPTAADPETPALPTHEEKIVRWSVPGAPPAEEKPANESPPRPSVFLSASAEAPNVPALAASPSPRRPAAGGAEEAVIPNLSPDEPVLPEAGPLGATMASPREYSLRDQLRARLKEEERARTNATLATARDPDAAPGTQDLRYDRRLANLSPDEAAFSDEEREMREALRGLTAAYPPSLLEDIGDQESAPLFERVRLAHQRFQKR